MDKSGKFQCFGQIECQSTTMIANGMCDDCMDAWYEEHPDQLAALHQHYIEHPEAMDLVIAEMES